MQMISKFQTRKSIILFWLVSILVGCSAPGQGAKAKQGYEQGAHIIAALQEYKKVRGEYPDLINDLVPEYLSATELVLAVASNSAYPFTYHRIDGNGYALSFRYGGPGINDCTYESKTLKWQCYGHY
jgi:hypothetical protein